MLEKYERHLAEIQGNVKVLTSERDKTFLLYEQVSMEMLSLHKEQHSLLEVYKSCVGFMTQVNMPVKFI